MAAQRKAIREEERREERRLRIETKERERRTNIELVIERERLT